MPSKKPPSESLESSIQTVEIAKIRMDGGTQPRAKLFEEVVAEYAEDLQQGSTFPPVTVFWDDQEKVYWLADGFHRVRAHEAIGEKEVRAEIHSGARRDAVLYCVGANATHGLRRTNADKYRAVERLLRDDEWSKWSNREISRRCGVSHVLVNRLRKSRDLSGSIFQTDSKEEDLTNSSEQTITAKRLAKRGGTVFEIDTTNIGKNSQATKGAKRRRTKKRSDKAELLTTRSRQVSKGETWKLGKSHYLYCGDSTSKQFQKLLPSEIGLFLFFLQELEDWPQPVSENVKNVLLFYTSYGEDIDLKNLRQIVENCLSTTTDADDPVVIINLLDPSIFILMDSLYCPCYCAEPDPQRCTDALTAWAAIKQPVKKL